MHFAPKSLATPAEARLDVPASLPAGPGEEPVPSGPADPLIPHYFVRNVYLALLKELPPADVAAFFRRFPLPLGGRLLEGAELFEHLFREDARVPMLYDYRVTDGLEPFLAARGRCVRAFLDLVLNRCRNSSFLPGKAALRWFRPVLARMYRLADARSLVFKVMPHFTESYLPGHLHRVVKRTESGDRVEVHAVYITDRTFRNPILFDFDLICGTQLKVGPLAFGMPPYEEVETVADCRRMEDILWDAGAEYRNGEVFLDGRPWGRSVPFLSFCEGLGLDLSAYGPPDVPVMVAERDYVCPLRKRKVISAGCAYGAPAYLQAVRYRKAGSLHKAVIENLIDALIEDLEGQALDTGEIRARHETLLASLRRRIRVEYFPLDDSLSLDGASFARGDQAKLMGYLMRAFATSGRREFELRELRRLPYIVLCPSKARQVENNLGRIIRKLEGMPGLALGLEDGRVRVECAAAVDFVAPAGRSLLF